MSTDVTVEETVERPREVVAGFATNWRNDTRWIGAISEARLLTEEPFGVGSQVERIARFLGKRVEYALEVAEYEPGSRLVSRSIKSPFPMTVSYEFEDVEAGTLMRIRTQGDARRFYRLAGPLLDRAVRRGVARDLATLKAILEADGAP
jgi:hypothetical protein